MTLTDRLRLLAAGALLLAAIGIEPGHAAELELDPKDPEYQKAVVELQTRLLNKLKNSERADTICRIGFLERPGGMLQRLVDATIEREIGAMKPALFAMFNEGDDSAKIRILDYYTKYYATTALGEGFDPKMIEVTRRGLESSNRKLRQSAARFAATWPFAQIANIVIDATLDDPQLTVAAIQHIEVAADPIGARWAASQIASKDTSVRAAALRAVARLDRAAAKHVRAMAEDADTATRRAGIEGVLILAKEEDRSFLQSWLERFGREDEALQQRILSALAALELGSYEPTWPPKPPLGF